MRGRGSKRPRPGTPRTPSASRPPCGGVDRNNWIVRAVQDSAQRRPPCGGVDRNYLTSAMIVQTNGSPSVRGRGSKHARRAGGAGGAPVALRAGAWIETRQWLQTARAVLVALRAGAWIETSASPTCGQRSRSRPPCGGVDRNTRAEVEYLAAKSSPSVRGRGSKPADAQEHRQVGGVALRAGAWIETDQTIGRRRCRACRPPCGGVDRNRSVSGSTLSPNAVALRAGAWIETTRPRVSSMGRRVALRAGAWIETVMADLGQHRALDEPDVAGTEDGDPHRILLPRAARLRGGSRLLASPTPGQSMVLT